MNLRHLSIFLSWTIICILPALQAQDLTDGLVAYYPFNGNANDESGNGNNGTVNGATLTTDRDGNTDSALLFTTGGGGTTSAANIPISGNADRTISFWCKFSSPTDNGLASAGWGNTSRFGGMCRFSETHRGAQGDRLFFWGHNADNVYPPSGAPYDQWRHLVFVYHSSIDDAVCYANGNVVPRASPGTHNNTTTLNTISTPLTIHGNTGGFIDDVRIYNRALSEEDVTALYELETWDHTDGLVAYYPFNGNAEDESGNGNNGTVNGATLTTDRLETPNSAYDFDGGDDYIEVAESAVNTGFDHSTPFSFSGWVQLDDVAGNRQVYSNDHDFVFWLQNGHFWAETFQGDDYKAEKSPVQITAGTWYHLSATWDGDDWKLYVNAALGDSATSVLSLNATEHPTWIGRSSPYGNPLDGRIDDIRIYNRALSEKEVTALYNLEKPKPTPPGLEIATYVESDPGEPLTVDATPISGYPADFTYQWYLDGVAIPAAFGGTGSSVTFAGVLTDEGSWRVEVTNVGGSTEATFDYRVFVDTDGDGLSDGYESLISLTDPFDSDTDRDGLNDGSEVLDVGTDPLLADTDGDGFDDGFEIRVGYDPVSAASSPDLLSEILIAIEFRFNAANGLSYVIESSTDLENWDTVETDIVGAGDTVVRFYTIEAMPKRYFRARRQ